MTDDDIKKIEKFMLENEYQSIDFLLASILRLKSFVSMMEDNLDDLISAGDLD